MGFPCLPEEHGAEKENRGMGRAEHTGTQESSSSLWAKPWADLRHKLVLTHTANKRV